MQVTKEAKISQIWIFFNVFYPCLQGHECIDSLPCLFTHISPLEIHNITSQREHRIPLQKDLQKALQKHFKKLYRKPKELLQISFKNSKVVKTEFQIAGGFDPKQRLIHSWKPPGSFPAIPKS